MVMVIQTQPDGSQKAVTLPPGQRLRLQPGESLKVTQAGAQTLRQGNDLVLLVLPTPGAPPERVVVTGFYGPAQQGQAQPQVELAPEGQAPRVLKPSTSSTSPASSSEQGQTQQTNQAAASPTTHHTQVAQNAVVQDLRINDTAMQMLQPDHKTPGADPTAADWLKTPQALKSSNALNSLANAPDKLSMSEPQQTTYVLDVVAPDAPTIALPAGTVAVAGVPGLNRAAVLSGNPFTGRAEAFSRVTLTVTDAKGVSVTGQADADASGQWRVGMPSAQMLTLSDGAMRLEAVAQDDRGNTSSVGRGPTLELHTTLPVPPQSVGLTPASDTGDNQQDGITKQSAQVVFGGQAILGQTILVWQDRNGNGQADVSEAQILKPVVNAGGHFEWTHPSTLSDGRHTFLFAAEDAWGNVSATRAVTVQVDTALSAPLVLNAVASDNLISYQEWIAGDALVLSGSAEPLARVDVTLTPKQGAKQWTATAQADDQGKWSITSLNPGNVPLIDGEVEISLIQTDVAGNTSASAPLVSQIWVRTTPLDAISGFTLATGQDTGASDTDGLTNISQPEVQGNGPAEMKVRIFIGDLLVGQGDIDKKGEFKVKLNTPLSDGDHTLRAVSWDPATNSYSPSATSLKLSVDTYANAPTINAVAGDDIVVASELDSGVVISGQAEAGATLKLVFKAGSNSEIEVLGIKVDALGHWSTELTQRHAQLLGNGEITVTVTQTDQAGNTKDASGKDSVATRTFHLETGSLDATSALSLDAKDDTGPSDSDLVTKQTTGLTLTGTATKGVKVRIFEDRNDNGLFDAGEELAVTQADDDKGHFSADVALSEGVHHLRAMTFNAAGQASSASVRTTVTVDTTVQAPTALVASDNTINKVEASGTSLSGTGEAGGEVKIEWLRPGNDATIKLTKDKVPVGQNGQWSASLSATDVLNLSDDGEWIARITLTDRAGNTSTVDQKVVIDRVAPSALDSKLDKTNWELADAYNQNGNRPWRDTDGVTWGDLYSDANNDGVAEAKTLQVAVGLTTGLQVGDSVTLRWGAQPVTQTLTQADLTRGYVLVDVPAANVVAQGANTNLSVTAQFVDVAGNAGTSFDVMTGVQVPLSQRPPTLDLSNNATLNNANATWYSNHSVGNPDATKRGFTLRGIAEPGSSVTVFVDANNDGIYNGADIFLGVVKADSGTGAYEVTISNTLPDGTYKVRAFSSLGNNKSAMTDVQTLQIDTAVPAAPVVTQTNSTLGTDGYINAKERSSGVPISGTAEPYATVTLQMKNLTTGVSGEDITVRANEKGEWTYNINVVNWGQVGEGQIEVRVYQQDFAGNRSAQASDVVRTVTYDASIGAPTLDMVAGKDSINAAEFLTASTQGLTLAGSAEAGAQVFITLRGNGGTLGPLSPPNPADSQNRWLYQLTQDQLSTLLGKDSSGAINLMTNVVVEISQIDPAGNVSSTATRSFAIDRQVDAPTIDLVASDDRINTSEKTNGVLLTGNAETGAKVTLTLSQDGKTSKQITLPDKVTGTQWSYKLTASDLNGFDDAALTITAQQTDAAGNTSTSTSRQIMLAASPLSAVSMDTVSGDDRIALTEQTSPLSLTGQGPANSVLHVQLSGAKGTLDFTVDIGADGKWNATLTSDQMTTLGQGNVNTRLWAEKNNGEQSSGVLTKVLVLDTAEPVPVLNAISSDRWVNAQEATAGLDLSGSGVSGHIVTLTFTGKSGKSVTRNALVGTNGTWNLSDKLSAAELQSLGEGLVNVVAQQRNGDVKSLEVSSSFTIDTVAPAIPVGVGLVNANLYNTKTSALADGKVSVEEANSGVVVSVPWHTQRAVGDKVTLYWGSEKLEKTVTAADVNATSSTFTLTVPKETIAKLGSGTLDVAVDYTDVAGNTSSKLTLASGVSVTAPPLAPVFNSISLDGQVNKAEFDALTSNAGLTISGTAPGTAGDQLDLVVSRGTTQFTFANLAVTGGTWTATLSKSQLESLGEGVISLVATFNRHDNKSSTSSSSFVFDRTAPEAPTLSHIQAAAEANAVSELAGGLIRNNGQVTEAANDVQVRVPLPADAASGDSVTVYWGGASNATVTGVVSQGAISLGYVTVTVPASLITTVGDSDNLVVTARFTDQAGNVGDVVKVWNGLVDAVPVSPVISPLPAGEWLNATEAQAWSFGGTCQSGSTVEITLKGVKGTVSKTVNATQTSWTLGGLTLTEAQTLGEGEVTISAIQRDNKGNPSAPAVSQFRIDLTPPSAPTMDDANSLTYAQTQNNPVFQGTADPGATVTVTFSRGGNVVSKSGVVADATTGHFSLSLSATDFDQLALNGASGNVSMVATQSDVAGNASGPSVAKTFAFSNNVISAPTFSSVTGLSASDAVLNAADLQSGFTVSGAVSTFAGATRTQVQVTITVGDVAHVHKVDAVNGTWQLALTASEMATYGQGTASVKARQIAQIGGTPDESVDTVFTTSAGKTFVIDTVAPEFLKSTIEGAGANGNAKAGGQVRVTLTATENIVLSANAAPTLALLFDGKDAPRVATYDATASAALGTNRMVFVYTVQPGENVSQIGLNTSTALDWKGATATDAAGNPLAVKLPEPQAQTVMIDTTKPGQPTIDSVSAAQAGTAGGETVNVAESGAGVQVKVSLSGTNAVKDDTLTLDWGGKTLQRQLTDNDIQAGFVSMQVGSSTIGSTEGTVKLSAKLTDRAGNVSDASADFTVKVDTVAPATVAFDTWMGDNKVNATEVSALNALTGTGLEKTAGRTQYAELRQGNGAQSLAVTDDGQGGWRISAAALQSKVADLADGTFSVAVWQVDAAGNKGAETVTTYYKDTSAPSAPTIQSVPKAADGWVNKDDAAALTVNVSVAGTGAEVGDKLILTGFTGDVSRELTADDIRAGKVSWNVDSAFVLQPDNQGPTELNLKARIEDKGGNVSSDSASYAVKIDTNVAAPTVDKTKGAANGVTSAQAGSNLDFLGSGIESGAYVEILITGILGENLRILPTVNAKGEFQGKLSPADFKTLGEGAAYYEVYQKDAAGNVSAKTTGSFSIALTVKPPTLSDFAGDNIVGSSEVGTVQTLSGTGEAGASIAVSVYVGNTPMLTLPTTKVGTDGRWSVDVTPQNLSDLLGGATAVTARFEVTASTNTSTSDVVRQEFAINKSVPALQSVSTFDANGDGANNDGFVITFSEVVRVNDIADLGAAFVTNRNWGNGSRIEAVNPESINGQQFARTFQIFLGANSGINVSNSSNGFVNGDVVSVVSSKLVNAGGNTAQTTQTFTVPSLTLPSRPVLSIQNISTDNMISLTERDTQQTSVSFAFGTALSAGSHVLLYRNGTQISDAIVGQTVTDVYSSTTTTTTFSLKGLNTWGEGDGSQVLIAKAVDSTGVSSLYSAARSINLDPGLKPGIASLAYFDNGVSGLSSADVVRVTFNESVSLTNGSLPSGIFGANAKVAAVGAPTLGTVSGKSLIWDITLGDGATLANNQQITLGSAGGSSSVVDNAGNAGQISFSTPADFLNRPAQISIGNITSDNVLNATERAVQQNITINLTGVKAGDVVKLMVDGVKVGNDLVLSSDVSSGSVSMMVDAGAFGADGTRSLTASIQRGQLGSAVMSSARALYVAADSSHWSVANGSATSIWFDPNSIDPGLIGKNIDQWASSTGGSVATQSTVGARPVLTTMAGNQVLFFDGGDTLNYTDPNGLLWNASKASGMDVTGFVSVVPYLTAGFMSALAFWNSTPSTGKSTGVKLGARGSMLNYTNYNIIDMTGPQNSISQNNAMSLTLRAYSPQSGSYVLEGFNENI